MLLAMVVVLAGIFAWWPFGQSRESASEPSRRWELRWTSRNKQQTREAAAGSHRVVFVGDSITQNWESEGSSVWKQHYADRQALNLGISSDLTQHVLWRVQHTDFGQPKPELFVLLVGTNNSADYSAEEIAAGVKAIVTALRQNASEAKILLLAIFPRGDTLDDPRRAVNEVTNKRIAELADGQDVRFLDINHEFTDEDGSTRLELMPDALHLNEAGYAAWAAAMEPTITQLLDE